MPGTVITGGGVETKDQRPEPRLQTRKTSVGGECSSGRLNPMGVGVVLCGCNGTRGIMRTHIIM